MKEANTVPDFSGLSWRKSSRSTAEGSNGDCVEVAFADRLVAVRDSKNPHAANLAVPTAAFSAFLRATGRR
jgi:hypothetical protein